MTVTEMIEKLQAHVKEHGDTELKTGGDTPDFDYGLGVYMEIMHSGSSCGGQTAQEALEDFYDEEDWDEHRDEFVKVCVIRYS